MTTTTATARPRQRKPRQKPARFARLCVKPDGKNPGVVKLIVGKESADYLLTPIPADFGRGFEVLKIGLEANGEPPYHVNLDGDKRTCDCKGGLKHGHCKHADGIAALIQAGKL